MKQTLPFRQVDAFAEQPYRGNPAGVVVDADTLTEAQMQLMAREVNASETAFITRLNDLHRPPRVRFFTPTAEVDFCGHATLGAAQALYEVGCVDMRKPLGEQGLTLDSRAGELRLTLEMLPEPYSRPMWWLEMPDPGLVPDDTNPVRTCELLGITDAALDPAIPPMRTRDNAVIYMVSDFHILAGMTPQFRELGAWCQRKNIMGVCVATTNTLTPAADVQSRFFAPAIGIDEDPVTGSVHGPLAVLLAIHGVVGRAKGYSGLSCIQGRPGDRGGLVRVIVQATEAGYRARVGGVCFTSIEGEMEVPPAG
jgi:PhzF family phenazine biosynthesis protein